MKTCALALIVTLFCGCATERLQPSVASSFATTNQPLVQTSRPKQTSNQVVSVANRRPAWWNQLRGLSLLLDAVGKNASVLESIGEPTSIKQPYRNFLSQEWVPYITYTWDSAHAKLGPSDTYYIIEARVGVTSKKVDSIGVSIGVCPNQWQPTVAEVWPLLSKRQPELYVHPDSSLMVLCYIETGSLILRIDASCPSAPLEITRKPDFATGKVMSTSRRSGQFSLDRAKVRVIYLGPVLNPLTGHSMKPTEKRLPEVGEVIRG